MVVSAGEVLFDIFPQYSRIGGAPLNFAAHISRLGKEIHLFSRIGQDNKGEQIINFCRQLGISTDLIQIDEKLPTGRVEVTLDSRGVPDFQIIKNMAYDNIKADNNMLDTLSEKASLFYFGSLIQRTKTGYCSIHDMLNACSPGTIRFFDINLRKGCYNEKVIMDSLHKCNVLKANDEEVEYICQLLSCENDYKIFFNHIKNKFGINFLIVTKGADGATLYHDSQFTSSVPAEKIKVIDTVGAGDAFAAVCAYGLLENWDLNTILNNAIQLASEICMLKGAIPDNHEPYKNILNGDK